METSEDVASVKSGQVFGALSKAKKSIGILSLNNVLKLTLQNSFTKVGKKLSERASKLSSTESDQDPQESCSISEIEQNVPEYQPKVLPCNVKYTDDEQMRRTEKKLKEII